MTNTTSRKILFEVLDEVTKELRKKVDAVALDDKMQRVIFGDTDNTIKWVFDRPQDEDDDDPSTVCKSAPVRDYGDDEPHHGFNYSDMHGLLLGTSWLKISDTKGSKQWDWFTPIIVVGSKYGTETVILRTSIRWYDHFRPSVIRMKKLIEYARSVRVRNKAVAIEHHLAKIIPDRIDRILLEGKKSEKN